MRYRVDHDGLGVWRKGQELSEAELTGIDVLQLMGLGALIDLHAPVGVDAAPDALVIDVRAAYAAYATILDTPVENLTPLEYQQAILNAWSAVDPAVSAFLHDPPATAESEPPAGEATYAAYSAYAAILNKPVNDLTAKERRQALIRAATSEQKAEA